MAKVTGSPKTGGRKKGTPNARTQELSARIAELLSGDDLPGLIFKKLECLSDDKQVQVLLELMPYIYPKRKSIEVKPENNTFDSLAELAAAVLRPTSD